MLYDLMANFLGKFIIHHTTSLGLLFFIAGLLFCKKSEVNNVIEKNADVVADLLVVFLSICVPFALLFIIGCVQRLIKNHDYHTFAHLLISSYLLTLCPYPIHRPLFVIIFWLNNINTISTSCSVIGVLFLSGILYPKSKSWIEEAKGLDYGTCMAQQFFYGYLKLILPATGTMEKYFLELLQLYESKHNIKFICYKLFVLIPKSLRCPHSLETESKIIESCSSLEELQKSIAGVKNRVYKNPVYKLTRNKKVYYFVAEYATPLRTFSLALSDPTYHEIYSKHKDEIVEKFYKTLQNKIDVDVEIQRHCELIYYDDRDEKCQDMGKFIWNNIIKRYRQKSENESDEF